MDLIDYCSPKTDDEYFLANYNDYFYLDNLVDYLLFTTVMGIGDCCWKNSFLSTPNINDGHKWMVTPWDLDMSLGGNYDGDYYDKTLTFTRFNTRAPYNHLYSQTEFQDLLQQKWLALGGDIFSRQKIMRRINKYRDMFALSGAWEREYQRWNGDPVPLTQNIDNELDYVADWYDRNYAELCRQLGVPSSADIDNIKRDINNDGDVDVTDVVKLAISVMGI